MFLREQQGGPSARHSGPADPEWPSPVVVSSCEHSSHPRHMDTLPLVSFSKMESLTVLLRLNSEAPARSLVPGMLGCTLPRQNRCIITCWILLREQLKSGE